MPRLHVLGSGGWLPTLGRQTSCYLLETRRALIFFDCGGGLSRLHDPMLQELTRKHKRVLVLLSHWHQDHIEGLHWLPFFFSHAEVVIGGPSADVGGAPAAELLARFAGRPFLPHAITEWGERFTGGFRIEELKVGMNHILGERVLAIAQPHSDPSLGFRVRDVVYITDTVARPETSVFAKKASLLIHDAWLDREGALARPQEPLNHGTAEGAARVAAEAEVSDLLLGHLNPAYDQGRLDRLLFEATSVFQRTMLAADMACLKLTSADEEENEPAKSKDAETEAGQPV